VERVIIERWKGKLQNGLRLIARNCDAWSSARDVLADVAGLLGMSGEELGGIMEGWGK
jgi:hypothetical protein